MPKEITLYEMSTSDYEELEAVIRAFGAGGICVAISLDWLERLYDENAAVPSAFPGQNLVLLAEQQQAYRELALKQADDAGLIEYGTSRGFTITRTVGDKIHTSGEIEPFPELDSDAAGYLLCFGETSYGPKLGHAVALYKDARGVFVRDQNIGQMKTADEGELTEQYQRVMQGHWKEVNAQREASRKDNRFKVTLPQYRSWTLYNVRRS
jgi:hypothetical protein